ncbi:hypothetical protein psal_cds_1171 [Pandoravirus salinus]|uniref:Uncharacterized protein n=1 Tax=Pandoravirus salinus TaxID=1349410 RepID=S4W422_9VIRU|nr:hypothetical protein psal_cds_1171 [Pandoravirus salinus]AGO85447.1 hypothetical protein psal_cds_1171 [Pandoravirus salinus]
MSDYDAAANVIADNQPNVIAALLCYRTHAPDRLWDDAAEASDPSCLARLLDLFAPPAPDPGQKVAGWMVRAIRRDRPAVPALCDARDIAFDAIEVANMAARCGSVGVLAYLVSRGQRRRSAEASTTVPFDLGVLAWEAMTDTDGYASDARGIAWLCDVAGYAPRPGTDDLRHLIEHACEEDDDGGGPQRIVYVAERWPGAFAALPKATLRGAFEHCVCQARKPYRAAARLAKVLDAHTDPIERDAVAQDLDLWDVVVFNLSVESMRTFRTGSLVRILCLLARGERPYAGDTGTARKGRKACPCAQDPRWRHRGASSVESVHADGPADHDRPCDDATLAMLAPLGRWCVARPIRTSTIFSGWVGPAPTYSATTLDDLGKSHLVAWLAAHGFLLPD